jgi:hypothetical protein
MAREGTAGGRRLLRSSRECMRRLTRMDEVTMPSVAVTVSTRIARKFFTVVQWSIVLTLCVDLRVDRVARTSRQCPQKSEYAVCTTVEYEPRLQL